MNYEDSIKQLKTIVPDVLYTRRSRAHILGIPVPGKVLPQFTFSKFIAHTIEFGSSIALAGLLIVLVLGGFSILRFLTPLQLSSLNPTNLRAEAQAVNGIQLELANLEYMEPMPIMAIGTAQTPKAPYVKKNTAPTALTQTPHAISEKEEAEETAVLTVDDVLSSLTE